ncbi:thioredoxin family protein [Arcobacter sp. CECT 8985]|uniref:thioredoxin family protein n=1 Tax=Arcobacter sp. CECT 8985 TaxID=1935424 RepID=UPI00100B61B0|nr:thioredoxin family protein [Arcobacter sp. CECT 8985]RXJ84029.1 hypothetical protein CRU93_13085 [Arcobacter sp. CECT 8985]
MIQKILILIMLSCCLSFANINENKIISKAKLSNKQILVYAKSQECIYCKRMDKNVFSLKEVQNAIDKNYIFVKVDVFKEKLPFNLKKHYKKITPSFFILDKNGKYLNSVIGSWNKKDFLEIINENVNE